MSNQQLGQSGEDHAAAHVVSLGWVILARNQRLPYGEIDILADSGSFIVVIEVKTKTSDRLGAPVEMITPLKQQKLVKLAKRIEQAYNKPVRIDVITLAMNQNGVINLQHIPSAVGE